MFYVIELIAFVVAIGVLVTVHESGHFWAARWLGFDVVKFSVGFGRPLWTRTTRSGVELVIGTLPLGGYVKLLDEREGEVPPERRAGSFQARPVWARIIVFLAGPLANFVLAAVLFWILLMMGVPGLKPVVATVQPSSVAKLAGLNQHDEIIGVDEQGVSTQEEASLALIDRIMSGNPIRLKVMHDGQPRTLDLRLSEEQRKAATEPGAWPQAAGFEFESYALDPVIGTLVQGGAAQHAGLQEKDRIVSIQGVEIADFRDIRAQIEDRPGAIVEFKVDRHGQMLTIPVAIGAERDAHKMGEPLVGRIGVTPAGPARYPPGLEVLKRSGPIDAIFESMQQVISKSLLTLKFFAKMASGDVSTKNVSGPIGIASMAGMSALGGLGPYLDFVALISLSLGILNLLPLPILDGGQIILQLVEGVLGKPLSEHTNRIIQHIGLLLLAMIMSLAFYNDIAQRLS
jgi:regulator of sigma E protease